MKLLIQVTVVAALSMLTASHIFAREWIPCAGEDQYCSVPGTRMVRYGAGDRWSTKMVTGRIHCGNDVFGDPAPGSSKACYYQNTSFPHDDRYPAARGERDSHDGWTRCADEDGYCNFHGFREVRYGNGTRWNYKSAKNGIGCSNSVFGDPAPDAKKACYYKNDTPALGPRDEYYPRPGREHNRQARWVRCAAEDGYCSFHGVKDVRYGNGNRWNYKTAKNGIGCSNSVFGDPAPGASKECFFKVD